MKPVSIPVAGSEPSTPSARQRAISYIRFSSVRQAKGDSLARQVKAAQDYCHRRNLKLDLIRYQDLGTSGWSGVHLANGALGKFFTACEMKVIPPGTALVVESIDRLSRLPVIVTVGDILHKLVRTYGISIHIIDLNVVLEPGVEIPFHEFMAISLAAERAYQESQRKSTMVLSALKRNRKCAAAGQRCLTKTAPFWIKAKKNNRKPKVIPEAAAVVVRVFEMAAAGRSPAQICQQFNREKIPVFGNLQPGWTTQRIRFLLRSHRVLGALGASYKTTRAGRGYTMQKYYPQVVSDALFEAAQKKLDERAGSYRGRTPSGARPINILRGLVRHKDFWMRYILHPSARVDPVSGLKRYNGYYEANDPSHHARKGPFTIPAPQLESLIIAALRELTAADLSPEEPVTMDFNKLGDLHEKLKQHRKIIKNLSANLAGGVSATLSKMLRNEEQAEARTLEQIAELTKPVDTDAIVRMAERDLEELKSIALDGGSEVRNQLAAVLARLINKVYVGMPDTEFLPPEVRAELRDYPLRCRDDLPRIVPDPIPHSAKRRSLSVIMFLNTGVVRRAFRVGADWQKIPEHSLNRGPSPVFQKFISVMGGTHKTQKQAEAA